MTGDFGIFDSRYNRLANIFDEIRDDWGNTLLPYHSMGKVAFGPDWHTPPRINYPNNLKDSLLKLMEGKERTIQAVTEVLNDEGYKATINVPGVDPEDLKVQLCGDDLSVVQKDVWPVASQQDAKIFSTKVADCLDVEKIEVVYEFGALNITIPSKEVQPVETPAVVEIPVEIRTGNMLEDKDTNLDPKN